MGLEVAVGEVDILLPVVTGDVVWAAAQMITDRITHGPLWSRHFRHVEAVQTEQAINRLRMQRGQKLAAWVRPAVFGGAGDIDWAGGDQGDEFVLQINRAEPVALFIGARLPEEALAAVVGALGAP